MIAVVCPQPPALIPRLSGDAPEFAELREVCLTAVGEALRSRPATVRVVGEGTGGTWGNDAGASFAPFGADLHVGGPSDVLPWSLAVGSWLLDQAGWSGDRRLTTDLDALEAASDEALLVMADGSAKRSERAPGHADERARGFDDAIATALGTGDAGTLAAIDQALADELWCAGAASLRWLGRQTCDVSVDADLRYDGAPLGVGYWVAVWRWSG